MHRAALLVLSVLVAICAPPAIAADQPELGIALEGYAYPYPVHFFTLTINERQHRMAYMDVGPAANSNGKTVLLLHGRNFPASYWGATIGALSAAGYRVIAPDQLHFGKSSKPDDVPVSFDLMAAHTGALLDGLGIAKVHLIAHSMGNMAGVRFVRTFPAKVEKIVLYAPVGLEDYRLYVPPVPREKLIEQETALTAEQYFNQLMSTYNPQLSREQFWPYVELRERMSRSAEYPRWVRSYVSSFYAMWKEPYIHEIHLVTQPTLILAGTKDRTAPGKAFAPEELRPRMGQIVERAKEAAQRMPHARVEVFEGYGHMLHLETPDAFMAAVTKFFADSN